MDFSADELVEACDRLLSGLLDRSGVSEPPVDALRIAQDHLGIPVNFVEADEELPRQRRFFGITIQSDMSLERRQLAAARGVARSLLPDLLRKLGVRDENDNRQASAKIRELIISRLLVPTRMLRTALKQCKYDISLLRKVFETASFEMVAFRLLDLDSPCIITVADDGVVATRRANIANVGRNLSPAEQECLDKVMELDRYHRLRKNGWSVQGWPVQDRPFQRVILHSVVDDVE